MRRKTTEQKNPTSMIVNEQAISIATKRAALATRMGETYQGKRDLYGALGYPEEKDLTFKWYWQRYSRQDIAAAIIDRPVNKTWDGELRIVEKGKDAKTDKLTKAWGELDKRLSVIKHLNRADKLTGIGHFSVLLFGFTDIKNKKGFATPAGGKDIELVYIKPLAEDIVEVKTYQEDTSNPRYGQPVMYEIDLSGEGSATSEDTTVKVHHSRLLHLTSGGLLSEIQGRPRLKPIANRLVDLEKVLGGDAEMFWRGARPGYTALSKENYEMGDTEIEALEIELDKYEHDLRRVITAQGVDIQALTSNVADPLHHVDGQLQLISAQTEIPKRILVGSERGELASSQDTTQWLSLIKTRMEQYAEPEILRPFVDKCMLHGILPKVKEYDVLWEDLFSPSEREKVEVGKLRAEILKMYSESPYSADLVPPEMFFKFLMGLQPEQVTELMLKAANEITVEDKLASIMKQAQSAEPDPNATAEGDKPGDSEPTPSDGDSTVAKPTSKSKSNTL